MESQRIIDLDDERFNLVFHRHKGLFWTDDIIMPPPHVNCEITWPKELDMKEIMGITNE